MIDLMAVGELLIDMTPEGKNAQGAQLFSANAGGAPANVLAMAAKLGASAAFIGKVGDDGFGYTLRDTLEKYGIGTESLILSPEYPTTLALVHLTEAGERSFSFYRNQSADVMLTPEEIPTERISECGIFHFGAVSLTAQPSRDAVFFAVERAREMGKIIAFDPNYRPALWRDPQEAREIIRRGCGLADILKISDDEVEFLTGERDPARGAEEMGKLCSGLILVSLGANGAYYRLGDVCGRVPAYRSDTVDTTGAGDAFFGAMLFRLRGKGMEEILSMEAAEIEDMLSFANAAGSLTTRKKGAMAAMPSLEEIALCQRTALRNG